MGICPIFSGLLFSFLIHEHLCVESIHSSVFTCERLTEDSKLCAGHYLRLFISVTRFLFVNLLFTEKKKSLDSYDPGYGLIQGPVLIICERHYISV